MKAARNAVRSNAAGMAASMSGVRASFDAVIKTMFSMRTVMAAVAGATGLGYLVKQSIDAADKITKLAQSTGVSTETLSTMGHAADLSGVSLDSLGTAMARISRNASDAARGTGDARLAFDALGISVKNSDGSLKNADQLMAEVADRFARMEDGAGKTALAIGIFGRAGAELIPMLNAGGKGLREMQDEARALGLEIDGNIGKSAERFNDNITRLVRVKQGWVNKVRDAVLPMLDTLTERLIESAKQSKENEVQTSTLARGFRGLAVAGISVVATVHLMLQGFASLAFFLWDTVAYTFESVGKLIGGSMAAINEALQLNFSTSKEIWKLTWDGFSATADTGVKESIASFADGLKNMVSLDQKYTKIIIDIWNNSLDDMTASAENVGPKIAAPLIGAKEDIVSAEDKMAESIEKTIAALGFQLATLGATEKEAALLKLTIQGATKAQLEYAEALLGAIDAGKQQNRLMEDGKRITEGVRTQFEAYAEQIAILRDLLDSGAISHETFNRAVGKAISETEDKLGNLKEKGVSDFDELKKAIEGWGKDSSRAFADFAISGKNSFSDLIQSIVRDLVSMAAYRAVFQPLFSSFSDFGPMQLSGPRANGGPVGAGKMYEVNERGPELLNVGSRQFLMMGQQSGSVTPASDGGTAGGGRITVEIRNESKATVAESTAADGSPDIRVVIDDIAAGLVNSGRGKLSKALRTRGLSQPMAGR